MIRLTFCANKPDIWELENRNIYVDAHNSLISLRRTDDNFNYVRAGDYKETNFKAKARKVSLIESFYGLKVEYENCILGFRISTDGGNTWKVFKGEWKTLGTGSGDMSYEGSIPIELGIGDDEPMPGWMSEEDMHEGLPSLPIGKRNIAVWINMRPLNNIVKPIFRKITLFLSARADRFLDDSVRSVSLFFQNNYYFDDRVIQEVDRSTTYQLPYTVTLGEDGGPETSSSCKIVKYVRAYNLTDDPDKSVDIVQDWTEDGLVTFIAEQEGTVEFNYGNRPVVHIQTSPVTQLADEVAIVLRELGVEEWGPYENRCELNSWNMDTRSYYERWAEFNVTVTCQAHRTEQVMRMEEGIRRLLEENTIYSEGTGGIYNWTMLGDIRTPFRTTDQLAIADVPLRFGRYRNIGKTVDGKLTTDVDFNVLLVERST